eukprot:Gb_02266 [translate_table: standard]
MRLPQLLRNHEKNKILFLGIMLQLQGGIVSIKTATSTLKRDVDGNNGNDSSPDDVKTLCKQGRLTEALHILHVVEQYTDLSTYVCLLQACIKKKSLLEGKLIHALMTERGCRPDIILGTILVTVYAKCGGLVDARRVFDQMPKRNVVSWTVMVAAYVRYGFAEEALTLFYQMLITGIQPNQFTFASILPACTKLAALELGMEIHEDIIRSGYQSDVFVTNALVDMYAKCGSIENARIVFNKMSKQDVVSWTAMIAGYIQNGLVDEAMKLFQKMPDRDVFSWNAMIAGCLQKGNVDEALTLFQRMPQRDVVSWNAIVAGYAQNGHVDEALKLFQGMPRRDVVSWNAMIAGYAQNGFGEKALTLFQTMQLAGVKPNSKTFASVLQACANLAALEQGMETHEEIIKSGFQSDVFVANALIGMYVKCGSMEKARHLFDKMLKADVVLFTTMIAGYAQNGHVDEALKIFQKMPQRDVFSWNVMIAGYAQNGYVDEALKLFQKMPQRDVISWNVMISGYVQKGLIGKALELFQKMPQQNVVSWNVMIAGYAQSGHVDEALKLFQKLPERNMVSWTALIAGYAHNGCVDEASKLFQEMRLRDMFSWNVMISGYAQNGHVDEALKLFQEIPERDVVSWTAMIAGYAQNGYSENALKLFRQMQLAGLKPLSKTFASVLPACANLATLQQGMEIHEEIIRSGFQSDVFVAIALVDMYAKCGSIENARHVFDNIHQRDVVSWNAMIAGYAINGYGKEALKLFEQMQHSGMNPNHVTFVCVLSACSHAGLINEGWQYFDCMSQYYNITPTMEHYGCMVDLLGRAGCLDEAQAFINQMPIRPDATVWGSLLSACRMHNNIGLGQHVAENIFELDPKNAASYVLLSNLYATCDRWDGIEKVRKMMKERRVKKTPGCSWIEVDKHVHSFLVGGR